MTTATWEGGSGELAQVIDSGADRIVTNVRRKARGKASGADFEFSYWTVDTYRNGKLFRAEWFAARVEAFKAAGLA